MIRAEVNQKLLPRSVYLSRGWLQKLFKAVEQHLKLKGDWSLSIAFLDHRTMRRLNRKYRGKDKVTDILSFSLSLPRRERGEGATHTLSLDGRGQGEGGGHELGELLLAWPYVRDQAKRLGKPLKDELALLIIHGVLHLRGYDHETSRDAAKMIPLQEKIFKIYARAQTKR